MLKIKSTINPEKPAENFNEWMQFIKTQIENEKQISQKKPTRVYCKNA